MCERSCLARAVRRATFRKKNHGRPRYTETAFGNNFGSIELPRAMRGARVPVLLGDRRSGVRRRCRGVRGHPDRPRDHHHAVATLVRCLFRHLSRCGRHSDAERRADGLRAGSRCRHLRPAVPQFEARQLWRAGRSEQRRHRHRQWRDGRVHQGQGAIGGVCGLCRSLDPVVQVRRDGIPHQCRGSELLDLCAAIRAAGPHVRVRRFGTRCRTTCRWSRPGRRAARPPRRNPAPPRSSSHRTTRTMCGPI